MKHQLIPLNTNSKEKIISFFYQHQFAESPSIDAPLTKYTTIKVGGKASILAFVTTFNELQILIFELNFEKVPWMVLGRGSNIIFTDKGFKGVIIKLKGEYEQIIIDYKKNRITVGAGVSDVKFAREARKAKLQGVEFLTTIPGTIGGAIYMNAGAHGSETCDFLNKVKYLSGDGRVIESQIGQLNFSYRYSSFMNQLNVILQGEFILKSESQNKIKDLETEFLNGRKTSQPVTEPTSGCIFVNPTGRQAAKLIENCGLKGKGIGQAIISPKHGNFIENKGNASFNDIYLTIEMARKHVKETFGINLVQEVKILNEIGLEFS